MNPYQYNSLIRKFNQLDQKLVINSCDNISMRFEIDNPPFIGRMEYNRLRTKVDYLYSYVEIFYNYFGTNDFIMNCAGNYDIIRTITKIVRRELILIDVEVHFDHQSDLVLCCNHLGCSLKPFKYPLRARV